MMAFSDLRVRLGVFQEGGPGSLSGPSVQGEWAERSVRGRGEHPHHTSVLAERSRRRERDDHEGKEDLHSPKRRTNRFSAATQFSVPPQFQMDDGRNPRGQDKVLVIPAHTTIAFSVCELFVRLDGRLGRGRGLRGSCEGRRFVTLSSSVSDICVAPESQGGFERDQIREQLGGFVGHFSMGGLRRFLSGIVYGNPFRTGTKASCLTLPNHAAL